MSYGKQPVPETVTPHGGTVAQRAANATRRRAGTGGGSRRPYWVDTCKLSEVVPINIRLVAVKYITQRVDDSGNLYEEETFWREYREHFHGGFRRGGICSGGPHFFDRNKRTPCHGCDIFWSTPRGQKRVISLSDKYAFDVVVMENFHKVPDVDSNTGQFRMNPQTNEPYTSWERCIGQGCQHCSTALETVQGRAQPWILSKAHFNQLNAYSNRLGCTTCGGRLDQNNMPVITTAMWQCGNSECRQLIFDMNNTTIPLEQISEVVNKPYICPICKMTCYPEEVIQCVNCTPVGNTPAKASIFDVDLQVIAQRTGDGDQTSLIVLNSSDPRPLHEFYQGLLQKMPDLNKLFAPTPLDIQAQFWQRTAAPPPQPPVQQYAQPQAPQQVAPQQAAPQQNYTQPQAGAAYIPGGQR